MATQAWCSQCAEPAEVIGTSLDPDHPLVECRWYTVDGEPRGHGRTIGVCDRAELAEVMAAHAAAKQRRVHAGHLASKLVKGCPDCQALRRAAGWPEPVLT